MFFRAYYRFLVVLAWILGWPFLVLLITKEKLDEKFKGR